MGISSHPNGDIPSHGCRSEISRPSNNGFGTHIFVRKGEDLNRKILVAVFVLLLFLLSAKKAETRRALHV